MSTDAIITLESLRCYRESDGSGHSEPYIWPVLIRIDDETLNTPEHVAVSAPALGNARVVLKDDMRAGEVATIPGEVGVFRVRLEDGQQVLKLLLTVLLWEEDETPIKAVRAGFQAFSAELGQAIAANLAGLAGASNALERAPIIKIIQDRVAAKVESAIGDALTGFQKVRVWVGTLNLDDQVGSDFLALTDDSFPSLRTRPFQMVFRSEGSNPSNVYTIDGRMEVVPVVKDPCQALVDRVQQAQAVIDGIEQEIRGLQEQLTGHPAAGLPPLSKAAIIAEIRRIRAEDLPPAEAELASARAALSICRARPNPFPNGGVVLG